MINTKKFLNLFFTIAAIGFILGLIAMYYAMGNKLTSPFTPEQAIYSGSIGGVLFGAIVGLIESRKKADK